MPITAPDLFGHPKYWAECFGSAPFLPTSRAEMDQLGWDSCDIIIVTGDAYVDHPSFGMAVLGRLLEAQGFRVGIISQPDWRSNSDFEALGKPNLYFGVTAGNMDSMINAYTADLRLRSDDAYTPGGLAGKRPDRAVIVYSQRCKSAYKEVPVVIGGIEASLRRIAQYDYWSDSVRRSVLIDSTADILLYGNAERAVVALSHRLAAGEAIDTITDLRGTTLVLPHTPGGYTELDSTRIDWPGRIDQMPSPYEVVHHGQSVDAEGEVMSAVAEGAEALAAGDELVRIVPMPLRRFEQNLQPEQTCIRLPSFEKVAKDPVLYAHASRVLHQESNPHNARALVQRHGHREIWVNPPPIPLTTEEMDGVFDLTYARVPHPKYQGERIPAYDMIKTSVNIMRGCFGGCTFCSITEHEGRIIQSRSEESILREIELIKEKVPGFTGTISDLGGPTANMYKLNCKDDNIQASCRKLSCIYPEICSNLKTDHSATTQLYRKARAIEGVHTIAIASGLRYDLAVEDPEYVKELVTYHVGGYLKIAPEHSEQNTLSKMMKPGMGTYDRFEKMFYKYSKEAGKKQYLIPYFIAAHPGCDDSEMMNLALWLKQHNFQVDQVQTFYPSPMSLATAMYYSGRNPLKKVSYKSEKVFSAKNIDERRAQKSFLRYHDPASWPRLREALRKLGREDLIGTGPQHLVPAEHEEYKVRRKLGGPAKGAKPARGDKRQQALPTAPRSNTTRPTATRSNTAKPGAKPPWPGSRKPKRGR
ncbi:YgiQ family radical SAM protein [Halioxenophilus sp. WMMB6]|uniref:YgiQ family radical SAM protein n=1 Tax=Halioxenophilus sp. WMMB6 TaxID=3073815 RepID=UPI00295F0397|nr:YgiQ family radical SAM protein [Halioxenophilus sp. WMMB6]